MNLNEHTTPESLERYAFLWSEARLVSAAIALFLGGIPPILKIFGYMSPLYGLVSSLLVIAWVISGIVSGYLIYRWHKGGQLLFGGKDQKDTAAFFLNVVTGFNLGFAGLSGTNIGMEITMNQIVFLIVGILYLATAVYLWKRWKAHGERLFS